MPLKSSYLLTHEFDDDFARGPLNPVGEKLLYQA
jgi:hypothetical protein